MTTGYLGPTVQKQFSNSETLLELLESFDEWVDLTQFTADFLKNVWDISTAVGFGLDIWGRILGRSRYIQVAQTPGDNFGFNVNPEAVEHAQMGIGNGATTIFSTRNQQGAIVTPLGSPAPLFFRRDWQGQVQLSSALRTNSLLQSQALNNATWALTGVTVTTGILAPDGTTNAQRTTEDTSTGLHTPAQTVSGLTAGNPYTYSAFVRAGTRSTVRLRLQSGGNTIDVGVDLTTGTIVSTSAAGVWTGVASFVEPAGNGYYKVSICANFVGSTSVTVRPLMVSGAMINYTGDGVSYLDIFGQQLVGGLIPSSYIPTTTVAVSVTDYTFAGSSLTLSSAPITGAVVNWSGSYANTGSNWKPWSTSPFFGGQAAGTVSFALDDVYYRKLLLVKAASNIASTDCPSINALMRSMFGDRGKCYVGYDINHPMNIGYHFEFTPTPVEQSIIESGLFPQPAGTNGYYIFGTTTGFFGFSQANTGANPQFTKGWSQAPFYQP